MSIFLSSHSQGCTAHSKPSIEQRIASWARRSRYQSLPRIRCFSQRTLAESAKLHLGMTNRTAVVSDVILCSVQVALKPSEHLHLELLLVCPPRFNNGFGHVNSVSVMCGSGSVASECETPARVSSIHFCFIIISLPQPLSRLLLTKQQALTMSYKTHIKRGAYLA